MKLFQQLLVAGATVSLIAPIAAQASDVVNLEEMDGYVRSTKKQSSRLDKNTFIYFCLKILQMLIFYQRVVQGFSFIYP